MLSRHLITLLPCTLHTSKQWPDCVPAVLHGLLVGFVTLMNRVTCRWSDWPARLPNWCSCFVYNWAAAVYLALALNSTDRERTWQLSCKSFVGGLSLSVSQRHNHRVPLSVCPSTSCHWSPSARPAHLTHVQALDSATMRRHLGALWGGDVDNFCVWIIWNCCPNYWRR